jgi:hypothetical protein
VSDPIFEGIDPERPLFPDGIGGFLRGVLAEPERQPGGPVTHTFQYTPPPEPEPLLPWMDPAVALSTMSWEEAQRHASIGFCRMLMHSDRQAILGADSEPPTWAEAEAFYDRVEAERCAEENP